MRGLIAALALVACGVAVSAERPSFSYVAIGYERAPDVGGDPLPEMDADSFDLSGAFEAGRWVHVFGQLQRTAAEEAGVRLAGMAAAAGGGVHLPVGSAALYGRLGYGHVDAEIELRDFGKVSD